MRILLDTHALIWWLYDPDKLGRAARAAIANAANEILVSAASAMEVSTKFRIGKLPQAERLARRFAAEIADEGFVELPVTVAHATIAGSLDIPNRDPFDRLLIAQARCEDVTLASLETGFDDCGIARVWD